MLVNNEVLSLFNQQEMIYLIKLGNPRSSGRERDCLNFIHYESEISL